MFHVLIMSSFFFQHWLFHPLTGLGYNFWSGPLPDIAFLGSLVAVVKHLNCDAPRCWRYGPHKTADGHHRLCRKHHPDLQNKKPTLDEIHEAHRKAS